MQATLLKTISVILLVVLFTSCTQKDTKENTTDSQTNENQIEFIDLDSVIINYWKNIDADEYFYVYKQNEIHITSQNKDSLKILENKKSIVEDFTDKIDSLYLSGKQEIYVSRKKRHNRIASEYSEIVTTGFNNGDTLFHVKTPIGEESYDIEFSNTFEELIEILDSIIPHKVRNFKNKPK